MQCPKCATKLSFASAKDEFACLNCGALLSYSGTTLLFTSIMLGGVPWLVLEALFFHFESTVGSLVLFLISSGVVAVVAAQLIKPKLRESKEPKGSMTN
jgi:hypothetical protein